MARMGVPVACPVPPAHSRQSGIAALMCAEYLHAQAFGPIDPQNTKVWVLWEDIDVLIFDARELQWDPASNDTMLCPSGPTSVATQEVFMQHYEPSSAHWIFIDHRHLFTA